MASEYVDELLHKNGARRAAAAASRWKVSGQRMDELLTKWSKRGALILLGWFASSAYHQTLTGAQAEKAVPVLAAEAGCEHWRAAKATGVAKQAILSTQSDDAAVPSMQAIPRDCPHPSVQK